MGKLKSLFSDDELYLSIGIMLMLIFLVWFLLWPTKDSLLENGELSLHGTHDLVEVNCETREVVVRTNHQDYYLTLPEECANGQEMAGPFAERNTCDPEATRIKGKGGPCEWWGVHTEVNDRREWPRPVHYGLILPLLYLPELPSGKSNYD